MGAVGDTGLRALTAVTTGGASELTRAKPFQPGGPTKPGASLLQAALGPAGSAIVGGANAALKGLTPKVPSAPQPAAAATTGAAPVQQAAATTYLARQRARGYASTILSSSFLSPSNPALQTTFGK